MEPALWVSRTRAPSGRFKLGRWTPCQAGDRFGGYPIAKLANNLTHKVQGGHARPALRAGAVRTIHDVKYRCSATARWQMRVDQASEDRNKKATCQDSFFTRPQRHALW